MLFVGRVILFSMEEVGDYKQLQANESVEVNDGLFHSIFLYVEYREPYFMQFLEFNFILQILL